MSLIYARLNSQILPDRLNDFVRHYEKPKSRKALTAESYRIEDFLQGLSASSHGQTIVDREAAIPHFDQQKAIVEAAQARFKSSLFDIKQLMQADLLDSELDAARELASHNFLRAAGAVAGVVLEKHLAQVCTNHGLTSSKKHPTISDFNDALKNANAIDIGAWRFNQFLGDIRNQCDHGRTPEPTSVQIGDLIEGVNKVSKTIF